MKIRYLEQIVRGLVGAPGLFEGMGLEPVQLLVVTTDGALEGVDTSQLRTDGFAFQVELLHAVWRNGHALAEVPIRYRDRLAGESKLTRPMIAESLLLPWRLLRHGRRQDAARPARHATGARADP